MYRIALICYFLTDANNKEKRCNSCPIWLIQTHELFLRCIIELNKLPKKLENRETVYQVG